MSGKNPRNPFGMRKIGYIAAGSLILLAVTAMAALSTSGDDLVVISWSELGIYSPGSDFSTLCIHPPFSTLKAQVVKRGTGIDKPSLVNSDVSLTYEIPNNTWSFGKTNFWDYTATLFGFELSPDMGLAGKGLTGKFRLAPSGDHFLAEGIPVTPYTDYDTMSETPYQTVQVDLVDTEGNTVSSTEPVIPVSNEMNCYACHGSEQNILAIHPKVAYFDPSQPVLCISCHASNMFRAKGIPQAKSLSEQIHRTHDKYTNNCYACHPGTETRSLRGTMATRTGMTCQDCHGNMANVSDSIAKGRRPWLDEPSCGNCHGPRFSEEPGKPYRDSKGHGGLYCSACHGSPHAILPSREGADNQQNTALQGFEGTLQNCNVCHDQVPFGSGPHQVPAK